MNQIGRLTDITDDVKSLAGFARKQLIREACKISLLNFKDLTWYGHARGIIHERAGQFVRVLDKEENEIIEDSGAYSLNAW
ncbi:MAG: hypothetical protein JW937_02295 [Candidatus Omnitrophica bacterium]|nr:hypothetical protein [Candidatus Omnitrophota bacterium]